MDRRSWLKKGGALSALSLVSANALASEISAYEKAKFNPRAFKTPIALNFNENPII